MDEPSACKADSQGSTEHTCSLCKDLRICKRYGDDIDYDRSQDAILHADCEKCVNNSGHRLCQWCTHLRLDHIALHVLPDLQFYREDDSLSGRGGGLYFNVGSVNDLLHRSQNCDLCHSFVQELDSDDEYLPEDEVTLSVSAARERDERSPEFENDFEVSIFIDSSSPHRPVDYFGFKHEPVTEKIISALRPKPLVDWALISGWLENSPNEDTSSHNPPGFRVIDIQRGCIVSPHPKCKYATLSYVWGARKETDLEATSSSIARMEQEGFLRGASIPATINDAMIACSHLGVPYLWVDRLCILQDEGAREEAKIQINAMGDIYGRSHVTLVALEGADADHGLPGVSDIKRAHSPLVRMPGAYLIKLRDSYSSQVSRSKWATRGWTFQEALLSPRLLLFAQSGVFFEGADHDGTVSGADGVIREKYLEVENPYVFLPERKTCQFSLPSYRLLLQRYTKRTLTFDSDALDALSGILHAQYGTDHYYGIPFRELNRAILWSTDGYHNPRVPRYDDSFPSWSWLSVKGEVNVPELGLLNRDGLVSPIPVSLAVWAIPTGGSGEDTVRIIRDSSNACLPGLDKKLNLVQSAVIALERRVPCAYRLHGRKEPPWEDVTSFESIMGNAFALMIAWRHGCFAEKPPQALFEDTTWERYEKIIRSKWSSIRAMAAQAHGITAKGIKERDRKFPHVLIQQSSHPGRLLVYTQFLRLRPDTTLGSGKGKTWLRDERGNTFHLLNDHTDHDKIAAMKDRDGGLLLETIALSLETVTSGDTSKSSDDSIRWQDSKGEWLNRFVTDYDGNSRRMELNVKVHLMVLQTVDGISRRVGIAEGYLKTWISANPQFGTFVLE